MLSCWKVSWSQDAAASSEAQRSHPALPSLPGSRSLPEASARAAPVVPLDSSIAPLLVSDPALRNKQILNHLNAVLRYWREAESPMQKVGEPSDLIYRNQAVDYAARVASDAFASAAAEAALLQPYEQQMSSSSGQPSQAQRIESMRLKIAGQIAALKQQQNTLAGKAAVARGAEAAQLQRQLEQIQGQLELNNAIAEALVRLTKDSTNTGATALQSQVQQIERSAPDLDNPKIRLAAPALESVSEARDAGVITKARVLFELLNSRTTLDQLIESTHRLTQQATDLRQPLILALRATISKGEQIATAPPPSVPPPGKAAKPPQSAAATANGAADVRKNYDDLTHNFEAIVAASMPLSDELLALDQMQADLRSWRTSVDQEYRVILTSLLTRVAAIAISLLLIFVLGSVWRRATARYVHDVRRRRQWTVVRRLIMGFLTGIVLIFGFVTQFSSLATFAGFITAGLAVGLQTILLSLAAYFFIIGRYGVRVGDRISIASVTGDVIEVGLLRFYVLEVTSSGNFSQPTGRVAVFSNAVLFQATTPLYKQLPGSEYTWHQILVKLAPDKDYRPVAQRILNCVQQIYDSYRPQVERQHRDLETWMDMPLDAPVVQSALQLQDGGLQLWIRYPAALRGAFKEDEKIAEAILQLMASDEEVRSIVQAPPIIQPAMK